MSQKLAPQRRKERKESQKKKTFSHGNHGMARNKELQNDFPCYSVSSVVPVF
jgi:hypothetical protein